MPRLVFTFKYNIKQTFSGSSVTIKIMYQLIFSVSLEYLVLYLAETYISRCTRVSEAWVLGDQHSHHR